MATIDTSKIEGYAAMTAEQKVAALESQTIPDAVDLTQYVSKATFDKKSTEAADYSRQLKALKDANLTEEERLKQERADFEKERSEFAYQKNGTIIRGIFGSAGLRPEEYAAFDIDHYADEAAAKQFADGVVSLLTSRNAVAEQKARNDLLSAAKSPAAGTTPDAVSVMRSEYRDALSKGDTVKMVTLIRKAAEAGVSLQ
jgi:hypothetical protein